MLFTTFLVSCCVASARICFIGSCSPQLRPFLLTGFKTFACFQDDDSFSGTLIVLFSVQAEQCSPVPGGVVVTQGQYPVA